MKLDHITLRTTDLPALLDFFLTVFDLQEQPRPAAIARIPGHWLFHDGEPIVHLIGARPGSPAYDQASEAYDHIAFRLEGHAEFRAKLDRLSVRYSPMELPELNERRLFFFSPGGHLIEAVFREAS